MLALPPLTAKVPAPVMLPEMAPPPDAANTPVATLMVPVLVSAAAMVLVPVPPVLASVPALVNAPAVL